MRKLVVLLVLALLPLQAAAGPALALVCNGGEARSAIHANQTHHVDHGLHNHVASGGTSGHGFTGHGCCHFLHTAVLNGASMSIGPAGPIYLATASIHRSLFFPEQPQRPPLVIV
jgi:hypothetical protein